MTKLNKTIPPPPNNINYQPHAIFTAVWYESKLSISNQSLTF